MVAAVIIATTGYDRTDALASGVIAVVIIPRTYTLLREAVEVLLEATPKGVDLLDVRKQILEPAGYAEHEGSVHV